jgi:hypothetical protein
MMKLKILLFLFLFSCLYTQGQEIKLNAPVLAIAGNEFNPGSVNLSKWRLGEVHLVVLPGDIFHGQIVPGWNVTAYPNPFRKFLSLDFQTEEKDEFTILVTDITGKTIIMKEDRIILPHQEIRFDLSFLTPAIYFVSITSKDKQEQRMIKVQKQ